MIFPTESELAPSKLALIPTENSGKVVNKPRTIPKANNFKRSALAMARMLFTAISAETPRITNRAIRI